MYFASALFSYFVANLAFVVEIYCVRQEQYCSVMTRLPTSLQPSHWHNIKWWTFHVSSLEKLSYDAQGSRKADTLLLSMYAYLVHVPDYWQVHVSQNILFVKRVGGWSRSSQAQIITVNFCGYLFESFPYLSLEYWWLFSAMRVIYRTIGDIWTVVVLWGNWVQQNWRPNIQH